MSGGRPAARDAGRPARKAGRPVIGMCAHVGPMKLSVYDMPATFVPQVFVDKVAAAGCLPVLLPPLPAAGRAIPALDGLLVLPGPDVDPELYGARDRHPRTRAHAGRDRVELALLAEAIGAGLPVLGICRGIQLFNTLRGGTLHQHLPEIVHHDGHQPGEEVFGPQHVKPLPGSLLAGISGGAAIDVQCHHHQAIDRIGDGLTATGWAGDGTVEALEVDGHPFALAVQWHPERDEDASLFLALAGAARRAAATARMGLTRRARD